jgi:hypothetical protein
MKPRSRKKWLILVGLVGGTLLMLVVGGIVGWRAVTTQFVQRYHRETCDPIELSATALGDYPASYHQTDVPWIATEEWTCSANSLAMVAAQHGMNVSTAHCSFLMGFTYGASAVPGSIVVQFFGEPEAGLRAAAPYLGLERRYYVTDDEELYLDALRYYVSQGYAARLGLDVAVLYDVGDELPHTDLVVGYDGARFAIYETVCLPEFPCEPRHFPPGEEGLWVAEEKVLAAVLSQARMFSYPWRYSLTIFEAATVTEDLGPIWTRNGKQLAGGAKYGPAQGADAIEGLANSIERRGPRTDVSELLPALGAAVWNRADNAAYLREAFAGQLDIERAAALFERAADDYQAVLTALGDGITDQTEAEQIAQTLRGAAAAERAIGEILVARGE